MSYEPESEWVCVEIIKYTLSEVIHWIELASFKTDVHELEIFLEESLDVFSDFASTFEKEIENICLIDTSGMYLRDTVDVDLAMLDSGVEDVALGSQLGFRVNEEGHV